MTPAELLASGMAELGLDLSRPVQEKLLAYLQLMAKWNKIYNLTALRSPDEGVTHHLLDSLSVLPHVNGPLIVDVGSGAGLPGLVLAIVRPEWNVVSVETVDKKAAFQRQAITQLGLANMSIEGCRVQDLRLADKADCVVSRAFSSLEEFVGLTRHLLKPGGHWVAMKGKPPRDELAALPGDIKARKVVKLRVPGLHAERCVVLMEES